MATLQDLWKYGNQSPVVEDIPVAGLAIDVNNKKAYSSDGVAIFEIGGGAPEAHTHPISEVDGLQDELDGIDSSLDNKSNLDHTHIIGDVDDLQNTLNGKVNTSGDTITGTLNLDTSNSEIVWNSHKDTGSITAKVITNPNDADAELLQFRFGSTLTIGSISLFDYDTEKIRLHRDGSIASYAPAPTDNAHLTRKDYVDSRITNGDGWVRFDDGTQICYGTNISIAGNGAIVQNVFGTSAGGVQRYDGDITYVMAFISNPIVTFSTPSNVVSSINAVAPSPTACFVRVFLTSGSGWEESNVNYIAIGKWK